jgi:predicted DNA-binding transcriptional regulator YafY
MCSARFVACCPTSWPRRSTTSALGSSWLLTAWCRWCHSFRNFRLDRVVSIEATTQAFAPVPGKRFENFLEVVRDEA